MPLGRGQRTSPTKTVCAVNVTDGYSISLPAGPRVDLRSPADVKSMLRHVEVDLPDTRAWRLEEHRDKHPVVAELLRWRKAERIATTYGYRWLDEHVVATAAGGRLRRRMVEFRRSGGSHDCVGRAAQLACGAEAVC